MIHPHSQSNSISPLTDSDKSPIGVGKFVILPENKALSYWTIFVATLLVYTLIVTPYEIALIDSGVLELYIFDFVINFCFFIDLLVNSITAYYDKAKNLVHDRRQILLHYMRTWFFFDLAACLPVQLFVDNYGTYNSLARITRVQKVYKILRVVRLIRVIKIFKNTEQKKYTNLVLKVSIEVKRLVLLIMFLALFMHIIACFWVFNGRINSDIPSNWISYYGFIDYPNFDLYIVSFYWTVTTLVTVGYGDIAAVTDSEKIYACCVMLIGTILYSYTIGSVSNIVTTLDTRKAKLNKKLDLLNKIANDYKLNNFFHKKLTNAIEYEHKNNNKDLDEILNDLPTNIKQKLLTIIFEQKISKNSFFINKSLSFTAWVASNLKPMKVSQHEFVYRQGEYASEMYFLIEGTANLMVKYSGRLCPCIEYPKLYFFGELDLLFSSNKSHMQTVYTITGCELLTLSREKFEELLDIFEDEAIQISFIAKERLERTNEKITKKLESLETKFKVANFFSIPKTRKVNVSDLKRSTRSIRGVGEKSIREDTLFARINSEKHQNEDIDIIKTKLKTIKRNSHQITSLGEEIISHIKEFNDSSINAEESHMESRMSIDIS